MCAEKGWSDAKRLSAIGYAKGKYGFKQSHTDLLACASKSWTKAQSYVVENWAQYAASDLGKKSIVTKLLKLHFKYLQRQQEASNMAGFAALPFVNLEDIAATSANKQVNADDGAAGSSSCRC